MGRRRRLGRDGAVSFGMLDIGEGLVGVDKLLKGILKAFMNQILHTNLGAHCDTNDCATWGLS